MRMRKFVWLLLAVVVVGLGLYFFRRPTMVVTARRPARPMATAPVSAPVALAPDNAAPEPAMRAGEHPRPDAVIASAWLSETRPEMAAFAHWTARYLGASNAQRAGLLAEGENLARERLAALAALIPADPEQALADAVPMVVRQQLPPEILALLEERVSAESDLKYLAGSPPPGETAVVASYR